MEYPFLRVNHAKMKGRSTIPISKPVPSFLAGGCENGNAEASAPPVWGDALAMLAGRGPGLGDGCAGRMLPTFAACESGVVVTGGWALPALTSGETESGGGAVCRFGLPQCGHAIASVLSWPAQSGHFTRAMRSPGSIVSPAKIMSSRSQNKGSTCPNLEPASGFRQFGHDDFPKARNRQRRSVLMAKNDTGGSSDR